MQLQEKNRDRRKNLVSDPVYRRNGQSGTGYVSSSYIRIPVSYSTDANFEAYLTSQGFPESYKDGLRQLHAQYPNWVFRAKNTGIDWNTAIEKMSPFLAGIWWQQEAFLLGNQWKAVLTTGITVPGLVLTGATG